MRLALEFNALNLFNQHAIMAYNPNPFGRNNEWLKFGPQRMRLERMSKSSLQGTTSPPRLLPRCDVKNSRYGCRSFSRVRAPALGVRFTF